MGKKKIISEEEIENTALPVLNDVLGVAVTMLGFNRARNGPGYETRWNSRVQSNAFEFEYNWS